jgi:radical SAM-linked protein
MAQEKVRIRFQKRGDLRLVSHHDLLRCFERMLRRAQLPYCSTKGFNPKPRLVFALSLGLGIIGLDEVVELELDAPVADVQERLQKQAPAGLVIMSVKSIPPRLTAQVRSVTYGIPIPPLERDAAERRIESLLNSSECRVQRTRPEPRSVDIRPYLRELRILHDVLEIRTWVTPYGTARPDEVLSLLGLGDLLAQGAVLERTALELIDESAPVGTSGDEPVSGAPPASAVITTSAPGNAACPATAFADGLLAGAQPEGNA